MKKVCEKTGMSERTFDGLKSKLSASEIKQDEAGRWMRVRLATDVQNAEIRTSPDKDAAGTQDTAIATAATS